ncbi:MAG: DUF4240 domain-containing protein [Saprospiraceae bacterium]
MSTTIHLNLESVNEQFIRDLKAQFGPAELELRVGKQPQNWMTQQQFWEVISRLDWSKAGDDDAVLEPAVAALASMPLGNIHQFLDILSEKLWQLDTPAHALASVGGDPEAYLSSDGFLYDRCCVVANGQEFFERVLTNPQQFPVGLSFEALLGLAAEAYRRKTGRDFEHIPKFDYETGGNTAAWNEKRA